MTDVDRKAPTSGACHSFVVSCLIDRVLSFAWYLKRPFARNGSANELDYTGHCIGLEFLLLRLMKVFKAILVGEIDALGSFLPSLTAFLCLGRLSIVMTVRLSRHQDQHA